MTDWLSLIEYVIPFALLGAVLGLDTVSFPQIMISRPIVSATLAGSLAGDPVAGLMIGVVLELMALDTLPFGASRYPEWGSAGVAGGVIMSDQTHGFLVHLAISLFAALLAAFISSWSMTALRRVNVRVMRKYRSKLDAGSRAAVYKVHLAGILLDSLRAAVITAGVLLVFLPVTGTITDMWTVNPDLTKAVVISVTAAVALAALWKLFRATAHTLWFFLSGLLIGGGILISR